MSRLTPSRARQQKPLVFAREYKGPVHSMTVALLSRGVPPQEVLRRARFMVDGGTWTRSAPGDKTPTNFESILGNHASGFDLSPVVATDPACVYYVRPSCRSAVCVRGPIAAPALRSPNSRRRPPRARTRWQPSQTG